MSVLLNARPQEQETYDPLADAEAFEMDDDPLAGEDEEQDPLGGNDGDDTRERDSLINSRASTTTALSTASLDEDETMGSSMHDGQDDEEDPLGGGDDRRADDDEVDPFGDFESEPRPPQSGGSSMLDDSEGNGGLGGDDEDEDDPFGPPTRDADRTAEGPSPLERLASRLSHEEDASMSDSRTDFDSLFPSLSTGPSSSSAQASSAGPPIVARSFNGRRVTFSRKVKRVPETKLASSSRLDCSKLLAVPIHRMMDSLATTASLTRSITLPVRNQYQRLTTAIFTHSTSRASQVTEHGGPATPICKDMWVDKYRPKRFTDLVGDESVHRAALSWLKEWDQCVFKKRPNANNKRKREARAGGDSNQNEGQTRPPDEWGRPQEKILLLSGPPGLGKTTLAHVVAAQAGYNVLEINASDARTGNIIDERIKPALETGQGLGKKKPVLVVVDEVDGATGENSTSFVAKLIQLTIDGKRKKLKPGEKRNPKEKQPLLRPIICICNDLWASSILRLRSIARIVQFRPPVPTQLVKRLREICDIEGLKAESRALTLLANVAKSDFRGCLNTLQMIHTRRQEVTEVVVRNATVGMKESETTTQAVWNDIFLPLPKKRIKDMGMTDEECNKYVNRLARMVEASGTMDKVMTGCFAHYASLHHADPSWKRYLKAQKWLTTFDLFSSTMRTEQEYAVLQYMPYMIVPMHHIFVDSGNPKVGNPRADWECHVKAKACEEIYKSLSGCVVADHGRHTASFRHLLTKEVVVAEFAPLLNRIISPPLRPVNSQVIKPQEQAMLKKLVHVMVSLELRFVQERNEDGQLMYRLDPPVDVCITYDGKRASDIPPPRYAVRHMVAAAIEDEYAARQLDAVEKSQGRKVSSFFGRQKAVAPDPEEDPEAPHETGDGPQDEGQLGRREAPEAASKKADLKVQEAEKEPVDFFGRPIKRKQPEPVKDAPVPAPPQKKVKVAYKYNEGASAAVRKPIKMHALL
ncbi:hypothetical protein FRC04_009891 [Tulasnella sp. 424]|nr:hypothetical protein FRC04_009891 [Tulasnella sp. 424]